MTPEKCGYLHANSHWCQNSNLNIITLYCRSSDPNDGSHVVRLINESSLDLDDVFQNTYALRFADTFDQSMSPLMKFDKILTDRGYCFTTNLQNHEYLFKDVISSDFDSYKRNIVKRMVFNLVDYVGIPFNDSVQWTLEKGYPTGKLILLVLNAACYSIF